MMPAGFFPAVEPDAPVRPLLQRLRPLVETEIERYDDGPVTVHAELRAARGADGGADLERFYWSSQRPEPHALWGFAARTLHCADDPDSARVHDFPSEPALTWLDSADGPLRRGDRAEHVEVLRYIPMRRLTFRLLDGLGLPERVIAKVKRSGGLQRATNAFLAVGRAAHRRRDAPRVPRLLRVEPPRHALYLEELPGRPLPVAVAGLDPKAAMARLGELHCALQELEVKGLPTRRAADWLADVREAVERVRLFVPSAAGRAAEVGASLERAAPGDDHLVFCQGDFLPGQVLVHESGWSVVDLDDSRYADPLSDVADMWLGLSREMGLPPAAVADARREYLGAYADRAGTPIDRDRWRWYLTVLQLNQLGKRLTKGRVAPGETDAVLDVLGSGGDGLG